MKAVIIILVLVAIIFVDFYIKGQKSQKMSAPSYSGGPLPPCISKPNCVSSEHANTKSRIHYVAPVKIEGDAKTNLNKAADILKTMGGEVHTHEDLYIMATFTSGLFKFVDDVIMRIDTDTQTLHFRSSSRVGFGDFLANANRMKAFTSHFGQ